MRILLLLLGTLACTRPSPSPVGTDAPLAPHAPLDSLVLTLPDSTEVWLVKGREGIGADGSTCLERGVQLRKGERRDLVPLLYTRAAPQLSDGKLVATLSNRCADVATYTINTNTGQPTRR